MRRVYAVIQCDRETCNIINICCIYITLEKALQAKKQIENDVTLTSSYLDILETQTEMQ